MATLVGTKENFIHALRELIELDYDAIEAYETAINRIENKYFKNKLKEFKKDHEKHVEKLNKFLSTHKEEIVAGPSTKQWLTKGKVVLADLVGDSAILYAMLTNEEDTNAAYERLNKHPRKWPETTEILKEGLLDEKAHKKWLEENKDKSN